MKSVFSIKKFSGLIQDGCRSLSYLVFLKAILFLFYFQEQSKTSRRQMVGTPKETTIY